jgi:hypothetical protein
MRYISFLILSATLLVACGAASTGSAAPTSPPAAPTQPAASTQPPEATAGPAAPSQPPIAPPTAAPEPTTPPAAATPPQPGKGDAVPPTGDLKGVLVIFKRSGGIAGVNETLTVYDDGRITVAGRRGESTAQVAPAELSELRRLLASPEFAALDARYPAVGADLFIYSITIPTGGKPQTIVTMDGAKNPPILDQVLGELGKLLQAQAK